MKQKNSINEKYVMEPERLIFLVTYHGFKIWRIKDQITFNMVSVSEVKMTNK